MPAQEELSEHPDKRALDRKTEDLVNAIESIAEAQREIDASIAQAARGTRRRVEKLEVKVKLPSAATTLHVPSPAASLALIILIRPRLSAACSCFILAASYCHFSKAMES